MWKTGHSHLKRKMREDGILLGGEVSGHMFFAENWYGVDDGILASAGARALRREPPSRRPPTSTRCRTCTRRPSSRPPARTSRSSRSWTSWRGSCRERYETIDIDGARILFPEGWGLVRASNTNPYLTLRFEARTQAALDDMRAWSTTRCAATLRYVTLPT